MNRSRLAYLIAALIALPACTGLVQDSSPGGDGPASSVGTGGLAVDPRTENTFVLRGPNASPPPVLDDTPDGGVAPPADNTLYAISPDTAAITPLASFPEESDLRVLFPRNSILVIGEALYGANELMRFDATTLAMTHHVATAASYWGTRTSPSGTYVAVADNSASAAYPLNVIEADTLAVHVLPYSGPSIEALWLNKSDALVVVSFDQPAGVIGNARVVVWSMADVVASGYTATPDNTGWAAKPRVDVTIPKVGYDLFFSYTYIAVSPDDQTAVIPVKGGSGHELLFVNTNTGALRTVDNALGPVGYTADGSTVVSYDDLQGKSQLLLIDSQTLAVTLMSLAAALPNYFITREGNYVVVAPSALSNPTNLVIYDLTQHKTQKVGGPALDLDSFVSRVGHDELWLIDDQPATTNGLLSPPDGLYRLNFMTGVLTPIPINWYPQNLNILPQHDRLVLDDSSSGTVRFLDPDTFAVTQSATLLQANP